MSYLKFLYHLLEYKATKKKLKFYWKQCRSGDIYHIIVAVISFSMSEYCFYEKNFFELKNSKQPDLPNFGATTIFMTL